MEKFRRKSGPKIGTNTTGMSWDDKVELHRLHRESLLPVMELIRDSGVSGMTFYKYVQEVQDYLDKTNQKGELD